MASATATILTPKSHSLARDQPTAECGLHRLAPHSSFPIPKRAGRPSHPSPPPRERHPPHLPPEQNTASALPDTSHTPPQQCSPTSPPTTPARAPPPPPAIHTPSPSPPPSPPPPPPSASLAAATHAHIHALSAKRIATLSYLRTAHARRVHWLNTLRTSQRELQPQPDPRRLARRATHFLLLAASLGPAVLDRPADADAVGFLQALDALLAEFEAFQLAHPEDGGGGGAAQVARARLPHMFRRASGARRGSSASAETGQLPRGGEGDWAGVSAHAAAGFAAADGGEYALLLTPALPFEPDYGEAFAALCDVLGEVYGRVRGLLAGVGACGPVVAEAFGRADARVRRVVVRGVVGEFGEGCRAGVRGELGGIGRVVLGGLV